jgi:hypothetical protein
MKCKNAKVNEVKIEGVCRDCLERKVHKQQQQGENIVEKQREQREGGDENREAKDRGGVWALRRMIAEWFK